ncbi:MAG: tRNA 2-thiouridine(34) synthase MnmA [Coriobacteriia bacterium]
MPEIAVAISGGVDSSVAAALLVERGLDVFGVTMRLGLAEIAGRPCCGEEEVMLARRVCATLGIPHVVVDVADEFAREVVEPFCDEYAAGRTPNPCVRCNERIKLGLLARRVRALGATTLATGHYARLGRTDTGMWLERAVDAEKDQLYFLYRVEPNVLDMLEFPLGDLTKAQVRALAAERGLPTAGRRESQEVCFTSDHASLVGASHPASLEPGPILDREGRVVGSHRGVARYTVGQRKGLGIGGAGDPYRVVSIDPVRNAIVVDRSGTTTVTEVSLSEILWRLGPGEHRVGAQVRYRARPIPATARVNAGSDTLLLVPDEPLARVAPGQSVVMYQDDRVVGGGIVTH